MRLLTHNVLQCPRTQAYPLKLEAKEIETEDVDFDKDFLIRMIPRLDWKVLCQTAAELKLGYLSESPPNEESSEDDLRQLHRVLLEVHVKEGDLINPEGNRYKITDGIPNMMIADVAQRPGRNQSTGGQGNANGNNESDEDAES